MCIRDRYNAGIITGYPDGTFRPSDPITRAEFATIAAKFDDLDLGSASAFTDIFGHWAADYITSSENKGWIKGYPDMTFKPEQDKMCIRDRLRTGQAHWKDRNTMMSEMK